MRVMLLRHLVWVEACRRSTQCVGNQLRMMLNEFFGIDVFEITPECRAGSKTLVKLPDKTTHSGNATIFVKQCRHLLRHADTPKQLGQ